MALPKLASLKFTTKLPSNGKEIEYRPFLVKEEKALLVAMESADTSQMILSLREIVNNCIQNEEFDVGTAPFFDSEYLFLQIRAKSVGEVSELEYGHTDGVTYSGEPCDHISKLKVNLEEITAKKLEGHNEEIQITDTLKIKMKYPSLVELSTLDFEDQELSDEFKLVAQCIDYVFDDNETYEADTLEEKVSFVESMNTIQMTKLSEFFDTMPRIRHEIKYTCEGCGQEDVLKLEGLSDFF
jgi:hypothetical protein